jgi:hypothetical protein
MVKVTIIGRRSMYGKLRRKHGVLLRFIGEGITLISQRTDAGDEEEKGVRAL